MTEKRRPLPRIPRLYRLPLELVDWIDDLHRRDGCDRTAIVVRAIRELRERTEAERCMSLKS